MITERMINDISGPDYLNLAFINENGIREQINPAILLSHINNESIEDHLKVDLDCLKTHRPELFAKQIIQVEKTVFVPKDEWVVDEIDPNIMRKVTTEVPTIILVDTEVDLDIKPLILVAHEKMLADIEQKKLDEQARIDAVNLKLKKLGLTLDDLKLLGV
jgi:hypothetical protein